MTGHPLAFLESFDDTGGEPDMEFLAHQPERNAVVVLVGLDVIVDVDDGQFPLGVLVRLLRKTNRGRPIEQLEQLSS